jgi:uncharacterized peroxidase-related enzyme
VDADSEEQIPAEASRAASSSRNLPVVEEGDADAEVAAVYERYRAHFGRPHVPGILKCFATHPPLLRSMMELAETMLFVDGDLTRLHKEMISTLVSAQNACPYCADSHGYQFREQGGSAEAFRAIERDELGDPSLTAAEQALLRFTSKVNRSSYQITEADVAALGRVGWSEGQIAEAIHIAALFAMFNRVVNAFGLPSQGLLAGYQGRTSLPPKG